MPLPAHVVPSQGTSFSFNSVDFKCLNIERQGSAPARERVDVSTLDMANGADKLMVNAPLKDPAEPVVFSISFRGSTAPAEGTEATLTTTGGSGTYRCTESRITRAVGQFVEGSATFTQVIAD